MLRAAGPAEIVRCNQKDESYLMFIKRSLGDIAQSVFGPRSWLKWRKELDLAADLLYFGLTTFAGFQTLGEEYVNILQVDPTQRKIPSHYHRGVMILLQVAAPYVLDRVLIYLQKQIESNMNLLMSQTARNVTLLMISVTRHVVSLLHHCHLTMFYINGLFYHIAKRFTGIHYIRVRRDLGAADTARSNYRLLGWLSMIQLTLTFIQHVYRHLKTASSEENVSLLSGLQVSNRKFSVGLEEGSESLVDAGRKCSLCLETRKRSTATPCGHLFCWDCIAEWCSNKAECPLCREKCATSRLIFLQNFDSF